MYFGHPYHYGMYTLGGTSIDIVESHKDLSILFDSNLKFHQHTAEVTAKANCVLHGLD